MKENKNQREPLINKNQRKESILKTIHIRWMIDLSTTKGTRRT